LNKKEKNVTIKISKSLWRELKSVAKEEKKFQGQKIKDSMKNYFDNLKNERISINLLEKNE
jgi:hypothetical protein